MWYLWTVKRHQRFLWSYVTQSKFASDVLICLRLIYCDWYMLIFLIAAMNDFLWYFGESSHQMWMRQFKPEEKIQSSVYRGFRRSKFGKVYFICLCMCMVLYWRFEIYCVIVYLILCMQMIEVSLMHTMCVTYRWTLICKRWRILFRCKK